MRSELLRRRLLWLGLVVLVLVPYLAPGVDILDAPFVYDDKVEVLGKRAIRIFEEWRTILGYNVSRPLLMLSYAADFHRSGPDPAGYHVSSLLVHALAMLGALDTVREVVEGIPFADKAGQGMAEAKLLVLVMVFIYAFFKFAWSLRQFNFASVLIGAAPLHDRIEALERDSIVARSARMNTNAVSGFNSGVRAYYFGLAALSWFVHPWAFMAASTWVVLVLYRREFHSFTLRTLTSEGGDPAQSP